MDTSTFFALCAFATVTAFTPGPNNMMLAASGANFGFSRTIPHIAGVVVGFMSLFIAAGFGMAGLFAALPELYGVLKVLSIAFLLYLAWRIGTAGQAKRRHRDRPLPFIQATMFQIVNPKGVSVIISTISAYTSGATNVAAEMVPLVSVFLVTTAGSAVTWCLFGTAIARILTTENRLRAFNITMAVLLVLTLVPIIND